MENWVVRRVARGGWRVVRRVFWRVFWRVVWTAVNRRADIVGVAFSLVVKLRLG